VKGSSRARGVQVEVVVATLLLVGATWLALRLAPDPQAVDPGEFAASAPVPITRGETTASAAAPTGGGLTAWHLPDDPLGGLVEIAGGTFTMGSDPGVDPLAFDVEWWGEGRVQGTVDLATFYVGRFEVTVAQYGAFVQGARHRVGDTAPLQSDPSHPVVNVAWTDALAFTRWLDATLRASDLTPPLLAGLLDEGWRVDLPTEAQWEKAARGTDGRIYPWGNEPRPDRAQYDVRTTVSVGSFECPECAYPVFDMSGNVWEWTRSPYQPYPFSDIDDADTVDTEALWVMRGGSFGDPARHIRAANRGGADPGARRPFIGFRIALVRD